ncbi:7-dehydrocholesterol reductase [Pelomyxa schiedti]|nr:7-dehydrocholesterol reductase [Pelomyxa schiedti]
MSFGTAVAGPLAIVVSCPVLVSIFYFTVTYFDGSLLLFAQWMLSAPALYVARNVLIPPLFPYDGILPAIHYDGPCVAPIIHAFLLAAGFLAFEAVLLVILPGSIFEGPVTSTGYTPKYKSNGFAAFCVTMITYLVLGPWLRIISPTLLYDNWGPLLFVVNVSALVLCTVLYFKGRYSPTTPDFSTTASPVFDFYSGVELYPKLFGFDMKHLIICRFGMMLWVMASVSFLFTQLEYEGTVHNSILVSAGIQAAYIGKFFFWEKWYLCCMDIQHDHFGYMLCWGTMVWMPWVHSLQTLFLVKHTIDLPDKLAAAIFCVGFIATWVNYFADTQRHWVRQNPETKIWGKKPQLICARYLSDDGKGHTSILLASGWWGVSRHFHYLPDLVNTFSLTLPCLFTRLLPWVHFLYLLILLLHRTSRQDARCSAKYGKYWELYCKQVPYKLIPYIF